MKRLFIFGIGVLCLSGCDKPKETQNPRNIRSLPTPFSCLIQTEYPDGWSKDMSVVAVIERRKREETGGEVNFVADGSLPADFFKELPVSEYAPLMGSAINDIASARYLTRVIQIAGVTPEIRSDAGDTRQAVSDNGIAILITTFAADNLDWSQGVVWQRPDAIRVPGNRLKMTMGGMLTYPDLCRLVTGDGEYLYRITLRCKSR
jgi:hypothetical protein